MNVLACTANDNTYKAFQSRAIGRARLFPNNALPQWGRAEEQIQNSFLPALLWGHSLRSWGCSSIGAHIQIGPASCSFSPKPQEMQPRLRATASAGRGLCLGLGALGHFLFREDLSQCYPCNWREKVSAVKDWQFLKDLWDLVRETSQLYFCNFSLCILSKIF